MWEGQRCKAQAVSSSRIGLAQVVMSRGGYTSAIDLWSLGCIFGELLTRVVHPQRLPRFSAAQLSQAVLECALQVCMHSHCDLYQKALRRCMIQSEAYLCLWLQARVGSATTPHLQVAPLFAIHGLPKTPMIGCACQGMVGCMLVLHAACQKTLPGFM